MLLRLFTTKTLNTSEPDDLEIYIRNRYNLQTFPSRLSDVPSNQGTLPHTASLCSTWQNRIEGHRHESSRRHPKSLFVFGNKSCGQKATKW